MKKLLSVLISISLINIVLLGAAQGISEMENDAELLRSMKIKLLKAERTVSTKKAELLKKEEMLNEFKEKYQSRELSVDLINELELIVNQLRLGIIEAEQLLNDMRASVFNLETLLQAKNLLKDSMETFEKLVEDYSSADDEL